MKVYKSKYGKLSGTSYGEIYPAAWTLYKQVQARTKRQPYLRAQYFAKNKVFLNYFWHHMRQKSFKDRARRIRYMQAALDLIRHTPHTPLTKQDPGNPNVLLHRFAGQTKDGESYYVQIKENKKTDRKDFISVFPEQ